MRDNDTSDLVPFRQIPPFSRGVVVMTRNIRIASLDGIRGLAITIVFFLHSVILPDQGYERLKGVLSIGHAGVDLFFVLSGFLITGILRLKAHHDISAIFMRAALCG